MSLTSGAVPAAVDPELVSLGWWVLFSEALPRGPVTQCLEAGRGKKNNSPSAVCIILN